MTRLFSLAAVLMVCSAASAQNCPGGVCPTPATQYQFAPQLTPLAPLGPTPIGSPPSAQHEWKVIPGHGYGWGLKAPNSGPPAPGVVASDPPVVEGLRGYRAKHGRLFYRMVRDRVYKGLVEKGKSEAEARALVESLSFESIDVYAQHAGITGQIGDGTILQWLVDHREQIAALVKFILMLLAFAGKDMDPDTFAFLLEGALHLLWLVG